MHAHIHFYISIHTCTVCVRMCARGTRGRQDSTIPQTWNKTQTEPNLPVWGRLQNCKLGKGSINPPLTRAAVNGHRNCKFGTEPNLTRAAVNGHQNCKFGHGSTEPRSGHTMDAPWTHSGHSVDTQWTHSGHCKNPRLSRMALRALL